MIHVEVHRDPANNFAELKFSITAESIPGFIDLISRGLNCFPNVHPELKELGDMLTHGKILQDYYGSRTDTKPHRL